MFVDTLVDAFGDELRKIASARNKLAGVTGAAAKQLAPIAAGIAGWEILRKANSDRKTGRQMRIQQGY